MYCTVCFICLSIYLHVGDCGDCAAKTLWHLWQSSVPSGAVNLRHLRHFSPSASETVRVNPSVSSAWKKMVINPLPDYRSYLYIKQYPKKTQDWPGCGMRETPATCNSSHSPDSDDWVFVCNTWGWIHLLTDWEENTNGYEGMNSGSNELRTY